MMLPSPSDPLHFPLFHSLLSFHLLQTLSFSLWFYDLFHNLMIKSWVSSVINFGTILWITLDPSSSFLSFFATRALRENCSYTSEFIFAFHQSSVIATALYLKLFFGTPDILLSSKTCIYQSASRPIFALVIARVLSIWLVSIISWVRSGDL